MKVCDRLISEIKKNQRIKENKEYKEYKEKNAPDGI
jgi:hypothetical protein